MRNNLKMQINCKESVKVSDAFHKDYFRLNIAYNHQLDTSDVPIPKFFYSDTDCLFFTFYRFRY